MKTRKLSLWGAALLALMISSTALTSCRSDDVPEEPEKPGASEKPATLEISGKHDVWMWTITLKENGCELSGKCSGYTISLGSHVDSLTMAKLDATFDKYERLELRDSTVVTLSGDNKLTFTVSSGLTGYPIILRGQENETATLRVLQLDGGAEIALEANFRAAEGWQIQKTPKDLKDGTHEVSIKINKKEE